MKIFALLMTGVAATLAAGSAFAAPPPYQIGSSNTAVIEPPVAHPDETPCVVKLYRNAQFGADKVNFEYKPPANCPGPYSAIVLSVDVSVTAGRQFDRTGNIWIGGVPLWFGTTSEPRSNLAPNWHFERDVTDYTSLLNGANPGFVLITNYTDQTYTSIISSSANLLFYPVPAGGTPPVVPDVIIPLSANGGGTVALNAGTDTIAIDQTLPTNIASANLDVFLQSQSNDEFWYTCVPDNLAGQLQSCGGGSFREGEVTVDGAPAGVAPIYPWIYTGGIDPYLWEPIPGVQTLNFKPFRVPLTPFAGVLSNGAIAHQIAVSAFGANNYFSAAGALMLYLDHGGAQVTGAITKNTLSAQPSPVVTNTIANKNGVTSGMVNTSSTRDFVISGTVVTSAGKQNYTVNQKGRFSNDQTFKISNSVFVQDIAQGTDTLVKTVSKSPAGTVTQTNKYSYPLTVDIHQHPTKDGNIALHTAIAQDFDKNASSDDGALKTTSTEQNSIGTKDTLLFTSGGGFIGHQGMKSTAHYKTTDSTGACFERTLKAANSVLTDVKKGCK